ncbi:MAG TPA: hypothetical protein VN176_10035 [Verrucomicrobiae bacterium]|nr:hypothetical protein [Verrucomicrobiae bacterium]
MIAVIGAICYLPIASFWLIADLLSSDLRHLRYQRYVFLAFVFCHSLVFPSKVRAWYRETLAKSNSKVVHVFNELRDGRFFRFYWL